MHEPSVHPIEPRNIIENISPEIIVIPLLDDLTVIIQSHATTPIHRRRWIFFEPKRHDPLHEKCVALHHAGADLHAQVLGTLLQPLSHSSERLDTVNLLNRITKPDVLMIVRKYARPIEFARGVVDIGPQSRQLLFGGDSVVHTSARLLVSA